MSGKGSGRRPEAAPNAYASGWDRIFGKGQPDSPAVDEGWPESLPAYRPQPSKDEPTTDAE